MIDCSCYHDEINFLGKRGVCWGTKEREACSCGGDAAKCDFYPSVREEEKKPITNYDLLIRKTPEELARWIADDLIEPGYYEGDTCYEIWLDWLRQEVGE